MIEYVPIIESPCVSICVMDEATGWCIGCGRTLDEIARWGSTDQADRDAVMAELPARMEKLAS
ncbi:putative Fe-S protein YdhL (DUF1289 family) [Sphingomonas kyeonggiensis]|uniref:DUF1289 domain-containing protein n=1 Tax=Sphingomonas kyeonggiensis TaxID=1268553 RepID=UPI002785A05F|nr:DUF1289 domain-containing protein [Sphingomonas kyeonggiensis]MDQ0249879.1 putative Fe-S protein YdhL (DUF1289 family) [Sphingomonas kyeonggiensis]